MFKSFKIILSATYSRVNRNNVKIIFSNILDLITTGINLVAPVVIATILTEDNNKNTVSNDSDPQIHIKTYILPLAASGLLVAKFLPKIRNFFIDSVRTNVQKELTKKMVAKAYDLELDHHLTSRTSDFSQAISKNYSSIDLVIPNFFGEIVPFGLDAIAISSYKIWRFGAIGTIYPSLIIVHQCLNFLLEKKSLPIRKECVAESYRGYGTVIEAINNYRIAHEFGNVDHELKKVHAALEKTEEKYRTVHYNDDRKSIFFSVFNNLGTAGSILAYIFLSPTNKNILETILYIYFVMYLNTKLEILPNAISAFYNGITDAEKIKDFLLREAIVNDDEYAKELESHHSLKIEFKNVSFKYNNEDKLALDKVSFTIDPGKKLAIVGLSGGGKSTIIKLLFRFYMPTNGTILINDVDINSYTLKSLRKNLGIVNQDPVVFHETVANNIRYGDLECGNEEIEEAACYAGLISEQKESISIIEEGEISISNNDKIFLQKDVGQQGAKLSGGERQRVGIARALLKGGKMLCLDEPTSSLDVKTERQVQQTLDDITESTKTTTLLITHRLATASNADTIIYLEDGKIQEEGDFDTLIKKQGKFYNLLEIQSKELGFEIEKIKKIEKENNNSFTFKDNKIATFWNKRSEKIAASSYLTIPEDTNTRQLLSINNKN